MRETLSGVSGESLGAPGYPLWVNDQVAAKQLSQKKLDSVAWWNDWAEIIETTCSWLSKVKWSVDAKVVKIERSGVGS